MRPRTCNMKLVCALLVIGQQKYLRCTDAILHSSIHYFSVEYSVSAASYFIFLPGCFLSSFVLVTLNVGCRVTSGRGPPEQAPASSSWPLHSFPVAPIPPAVLPEHRTLTPRAHPWTAGTRK